MNAEEETIVYKVEQKYREEWAPYATYDWLPRALRDEEALKRSGYDARVVLVKTVVKRYVLHHVARQASVESEGDDA